MSAAQDVYGAFIDEDGWPRKTPLARHKVLVWMSDSSLEIRGVLYHFLHELDDTARVEPPLATDELFQFAVTYFEGCLAAPQGSDSRWILTGTDLSHAIAYWSQTFWKRQRKSPNKRKQLVSWLRSILISFPNYQGLVAVALEDHLFSDQKIRKEFAAWGSDPELSPLFPDLS